ncbi:MAG TPA: hypothetical protein G4O08_06520, partial [Anaerolineae bacterium]|nr:hypothetical protein [Anaerolineae bacterium]
MLLETTTSIAICALYSLAVFCFGALVLRLVARKRHAAVEEDGLSIFLTAFLLGQGLMAAFWQLLALVGWFSLLVIIAVLAISFLAGIRFALPIVAAVGRQVRTAIRDYRRESAPWLVIYALTVLLILMTGITTINPPQPRGDSLAFYMALPKVMASSQRLLPLPGYEAFTQIGLQGEFHFAALFSLSGGVASKMFTWPMSLAAAGMLAVVGRKAGLGRRGRWMALAALFTSTAFTSVIWNGKVDLFSTAMGLTAFAWSLELGKDSNDEVVRIAGLAAGLAIAAKITYLIPLIPGLLLILLWRLRASRNQEPLLGRAFLSTAWKTTFWLGFWTVLAFLPNVIKNTMLFSQPLAPLFNAEQTTRWMQAWFSPGTTGKILLTYPLSLVYGKFWGQGGQISPLLLAFLPLAFLLPKPEAWKKNKLLQATSAGLLGVVLWHVYSPSAFAPRNTMASLLLLLLPGVRGAEYCLDLKEVRSRILNAMIWASVLVVLVIGISGIINITKTGILRAIGRVSLCEMETYGSDATCRIAQILNNEAEPEERVF